MGSQATKVERPVKYQFGEFELFPTQGALRRAGKVLVGTANATNIARRIRYRHSRTAMKP